MSKATKESIRQKRKLRIRKRVQGSTERPRLTVYRSVKHVYAQIVDDAQGKTLEHVHSFKKGGSGNANKEVCHALGKKLAEKCKAKNITKVVFDKNGFAYHGRLKAFADGAREGGLEF